MLNIRKEDMAGMAVIAVYGLVLGTLPHALASNVVPEPKVVEVVVVDPLEEFRNAKSLDGAELKSLLKAVGFEGKSLRVAWAVAMKESNGRPLAHNDNLSTGDNSYGIFQINMLGQLGIDRREKFDLEANKDLYDPITNAQIAYHMTAGGKDWSSWKINPEANNGQRYDSFYEEFPKGK
jgi:hypothetical protein